MGRVILRVDGSGRIGMGHIMRCIAFAQGFEKVGVKTVFVSKDYEQDIVEFIQNSGFHAVTIAKNCSSSEDAALTLDSAEKYSANVIVTDISNIDTLADINTYQQYLRLLKNGGKFLITIDGFNGDCLSSKLTVPSDMVIVPYYGAQDKRYKGDKGTDFLLGPSFFLFRQEFTKAAKVKRRIKKKGNRILVSMGGSDPYHLTPKVVKALARLHRRDLDLKVVIGHGYSASLEHKAKIASQYFRGHYELIAKSNDMAELMLWADLAVMSSGLTVYEAALMRTPGVVISQYEYQEKVMNRFSKAGSFLHLGCGGNIGEKVIAEAVDKLLDDFVLRRQMAKSGENLVDGKGVKRIIVGIPKKLLV
jgi:UDP-2,4-diacetamido-2,4,6-trideoxy-beta-L-altropyranose hydrolase